MAKIYYLLILFFLFQNVFSQANPTISETDRIRLAEAFRLNDKLAEKVWKNWSKTPFAILLVTAEAEFLVRHPSPSEDFKEIGYDNLLKSKIYWRKRTFNPGFLATFPAVGGLATVVVGQAENTSAKTSTPWVVTLLHEHFHQLQMQGNYYNEVNALGLANGDTSGMWMLNYGFPYSDEKVRTQFEGLSKQLADLLNTSDNQLFKKKLASYLEQRKNFNESLKPNDYKYFSFQLWQEGISRFTELEVAELAAKRYKPAKEFSQLQDYKTYQTVANELKSKILNDLNNMKLDQSQRSSFYPFGAGEALLLQRENKSWKQLYNSQKFYLDQYFLNKNQ